MLQIYLFLLFLFGEPIDTVSGTWRGSETVKVKVSSLGINEKIQMTFDVVFGNNSEFEVKLISDNLLHQYGFNYYKEKNGLDFNRYDLEATNDESVFNLILYNHGQEQERNVERLEIVDDTHVKLIVILDNGEEKPIKLSKQ